MDKLLQDIKDNSPTELISSRLKKEIKSCEIEREKVLKFQNDLYMDFKNEIITKDQYFHFKKQYSDRITELDSKISQLNIDLTQSNSDVVTGNSFVETFKKHQNITILTRNVIEELINMIYVDKDGGISIEFNFKDAFKDAIELIEAKTNKNFFDSIVFQEKVKVV